MNFSTKLEPYERSEMLIDANIFLEVLLEQESSDACIQFLENVRSGKIFATISTFTIDGIALILERHGQKPQEIITFLSSLLNYKGLRIYMPTMNDRLKAAEHMKLGIDFEDALTIQCAVSNGEKELMSFDKHLDKVSFIKRITP